MPETTSTKSSPARHKVLHMVSTFAVKTDTKWLLQIARHLDRDRFELSAACFYEGGPIADELERLGIRTYNLNTPDERDPRAILRARRLILETGCDIVHTHLLRADLFGGSAARWAKVPAIINMAYAKGEFRRAKRRRSDKLLDAACARLPTHTLAVSESVKQDCIERAKTNPANITVIHTGIDPPKQLDHDRAAALRTEWGIDANTPLILTLARLSYEKGIDTLIDAAAVLRITHGHARIVVLGDGPDQAALQSQIERLALEGFVILGGFHSDVWPALAAADIVCMPSKSEGMPNVLLEAMSTGRPVVATRVGGIPEAVVHEKNGLLVDAEAPPALAEAIARCIDDSTLAQRMGDAAQQTIERRFLAKDVVSRYADLYTRLLGERSKQRAGATASN